MRGRIYSSLTKEKIKGFICMTTTGLETTIKPHFKPAGSKIFETPIIDVQIRKNPATYFCQVSLKSR